MFFSLRELELRKIEFAQTFAPGAVDLGEENRQVAPLESSGRAELLREHGGGGPDVEDIRIVGSVATEVEQHCSRCLAPVRSAVKGEFDLLYRPLETLSEGGDEVSITRDEAEIGYYKGDGLLLEDVLKEQVLLGLSQKPLCREDCKGLCPHCGKDLNQGECGCSVQQSDPRWAALAGIKEKLKQ